MSRAAAIRKKALEHAKKRDWDKALAEFIRLAEIEDHNPNVFNELGDLHLKMGNRAQAFHAFHQAIDAYSQMSLHNNAVAVCKKIMRLNATDSVVYGKLARLRALQGFRKESESYAAMFLDKIVQDTSLKPEEQRDHVTEVADAMKDSPDVLSRIAECLIGWEFKSEAGTVLEKAEKSYTDKGASDRAEEMRRLMDSIGHSAAASEPSEGLVIEPNRAADSARPSAAPVDAAAAGRTQGAHEYGDVDIDALARRSGEAAVAVKPPSEDDLTRTAEIAQPAPEVSRAAGPTGKPTDSRSNGSGGDEVWVPPTELPDRLARDDADGGFVKVSEIVDHFNAEVKATVDAEDYRSHYDLGMAYLEMDLLTEAIREFQVAASSGQYQVRCLEMIGLCFLKQDQPRLAIKQLERGLELAQDGDREALGLRYNLGLAYEKTGDLDKARACFEDVYVVDVSFRDVGEKFKIYSS